MGSWVILCIKDVRPLGVVYRLSDTFFGPLGKTRHAIDRAEGLETRISWASCFGVWVRNIAPGRVNFSKIGSLGIFRCFWCNFCSNFWPIFGSSFGYLFPGYLCLKSPQFWLIFANFGLFLGFGNLLAYIVPYDFGPVLGLFGYLLESCVWCDPFLVGIFCFWNMFLWHPNFSEICDIFNIYSFQIVIVIEHNINTSRIRVITDMCENR